jgi:hypothetical protein
MKQCRTKRSHSRYIADGDGEKGWCSGGHNTGQRTGKQ